MCALWDIRGLRPLPTQCRSVPRYVTSRDKPLPYFGMVPGWGCEGAALLRKTSRGRWSETRMPPRTLGTLLQAPGSRPRLVSLLTWGLAIQGLRECVLVHGPRSTGRGLSPERPPRASSPPPCPGSLIPSWGHLFLGDQIKGQVEILCAWRARVIPGHPRRRTERTGLLMCVSGQRMPGCGSGGEDGDGTKGAGGCQPRDAPLEEPQAGWTPTCPRLSGPVSRP